MHTDIDAPRLSRSEFWKARGGLTSYSDLQEDFYNKISSNYGAERGESKSYLKNTNAEQAVRFNRTDGDRYDEPPLYYDLPYWTRKRKKGLDIFVMAAIIVLTFRTGKQVQIVAKV